MKQLKHILSLLLLAVVVSSCHTDVIVHDDYVNTTPPPLSVNQLLNAYELWYVDINETVGYGETPFLQMAFTISFRNGVLYANNNLVGLGSIGNGLGLHIGYYDTYNGPLEVDHNLDGFIDLDGNGYNDLLYAAGNGVSFMLANADGTS